MLTGSYRRCVRPEAAGTYLGDSSLALGGGSDREHLSGEVISSLGPEGSEVRIQPTCESWFQEMRWPNQEPVSGLWNLRVRQLVTKTEVTKKKKKRLKWQMHEGKRTGELGNPDSHTQPQLWETWMRSPGAEGGGGAKTERSRAAMKKAWGLERSLPCSHLVLVPKKSGFILFFFFFLN